MKKILFSLLCASLSSAAFGHWVTIDNRTNYPMNVHFNLGTFLGICQDYSRWVKPKTRPSFDIGACCTTSITVQAHNTPRKISAFQYRVDGCFSTTIVIEDPKAMTPEGFGLMFKGYPS